jgi:hypothetical protein
VAADASLQVELLDEDGLEILDGYAAVAVTSGLDSAVRWAEGRGVPTDRAFRIRVRLSGDARLYAAYASKKKMR